MFIQLKMEKTQIRSIPCIGPFLRNKIITIRSFSDCNSLQNSKRKKK